MTDVLLYQTNDDGDINVVNGVVEMSGGLETFVYLSLFGGDVEWWGNADEPDPAKRFKGEFQTLARSIPITPGNLRRLEDAARRDLTGGPWGSFDVTATIPALNTVKLSVVVDRVEFIYYEESGS